MLRDSKPCVHCIISAENHCKTEHLLHFTNNAVEMRFAGGVDGDRHCLLLVVIAASRTRAIGFQGMAVDPAKAGSGAVWRKRTAGSSTPPSPSLRSGSGCARNDKGYGDFRRSVSWLDGLAFSCFHVLAEDGIDGGLVAAAVFAEEH